MRSRGVWAESHNRFKAVIASGFSNFEIDNSRQLVFRQARFYLSKHTLEGPCGDFGGGTNGRNLDVVFLPACRLDDSFGALQPAGQMFSSATGNRRARLIFRRRRFLFRVDSAAVRRLLWPLPLCVQQSCRIGTGPRPVRCTCCRLRA